MTHLVLDPKILSSNFLDASVSKSYRIRLIVQVIRFVKSDSYLIVSKIPNICFEKKVNTVKNFHKKINQYFKIYIHDIIPFISDKITFYGSIINVIGFYNGKEFNAFECHILDHYCLLNSKNIEILLELQNLEYIV